MSNFSEFFLNSGSNIVQLETIEIYHPSFSQTFWVVRNAINGLSAYLETGALQAFTYTPCKIVPTGAYNDLDQTLEVQFGDLGKILPQQLDLVLLNTILFQGVNVPASYTKPTLTYRTWRSDVLTSPLVGPYIFDVDSITFQKEGATLHCSSQRLNLAATGELFAIDRFPMLAGFL
jgi:hypothetical protein